MSRQLVVKCTVGAEENIERMSQALTVAATAAASDVAVSLWLTGDAVWLAVPGRAETYELPGAASFADLRDGVLAMGQVTACTQCVSRRGLEPSDLIDGVRIAGAATFVEEALADDAQALVY
jgi:hypothetical protein